MLHLCYVVKRFIKYLLKMKFLLDENLPLSLIEVFNEMNIECKHVKNIGLIGSTDKDIASYAKREKFILVTKDLEFGNFLFYPQRPPKDPPWRRWHPKFRVRWSWT